MINITDMFVQSDMSFMSVRIPDLGSDACVYLTAEYASGNYHLYLLMAKSRVSPLRQLSVPCLSCKEQFLAFPFPLPLSPNWVRSRPKLFTGVSYRSYVTTQMVPRPRFSTPVLRRQEKRKRDIKKDDSGLMSKL